MATGEPLNTYDLDQFWEVIDLARRDRERYEERIRQMGKEDLINFYWDYEEISADLKGEAYVEHLDPALSEDGIDDVALWVVGQGKDYYLDVLRHPERIPSRVDSSPGFLDVVVEEYERRHGGSVPFRD